MSASIVDAYRLFHDGLLALARAERNGIRLDVEYCKKTIEDLEQRIAALQVELDGTKFFRRWKRIYGAKTSVTNNHQLAYLLYTAMKIPPPKVTESGEGATDEDALRTIGLPELDLVLKIRKYTKLARTYLRGFLRAQEDGYLHPSFNLNDVRTYRSSCSNPNFQNIPKRDEESMRICRRALLPRPGRELLEVDFSALEVCISACYHKDPVMLDYLREKKDMHADLAKQIFMLDELDKTIPAHATLRQAAKNGFVFPQFYGDYYVNNARTICGDWVKLPLSGRWRRGMGIELPDGHHLSDHLIEHGVRSYDDFVEHLRQVEEDFWGRRFRVYAEWKKRWIERYRRRGYLCMLTGFRCSGLMLNNEIVNYPIQGTAFHCLLLTFVLLDQFLIRNRLETLLVGQIHDSMILDVVPGELETVTQEIQRIVSEELPARWSWIIVPLRVEITHYGVDQPWVKSE